MNKCSNYTGITCVDGHCPNIMADTHPEFGYTHYTCEECGFNKGCKDCCFADENNNCKINKGSG